MADTIAYVQGQYFVEALLCTVGNWMPKKSATKFEYPEKPYSFKMKENELSEDEIEAQRQQFIASLMTMQHNFEISKDKQKIEDHANA